MPHFRWRGVTIEGKWRYGQLCALSAQQLEMRLLARGIACTKINLVRPSWFRGSVSRAEQAQSLEILSLLLNAGMKVSEAFVVTAETVTHPLLQEFFISLAISVNEGKEFTEITANRSFNPLIVHLMHVGYNAGTLTHILPVCVTFLQSIHEVSKRIRSALLTPVITVCFVILLLWSIFAFLVPSLTALFDQLHTSLPSTTRMLLSVSAFVSNPLSMAVILMCIVTVGISAVCAHMKGLLSPLYARMPCIGSLYVQWQRIIFMRALSALLDGGMHVTEALGVLASLIPSSHIKKLVMLLAHEVSGGAQLSDALASTDSPLANSFTISLVIVGQETNTLAQTLNAAAQRETTIFLGKLHTITLLIQPALILILGAVVLMVIASVYMPLISIAHVV